MSVSADWDWTDKKRASEWQGLDETDECLASLEIAGFRGALSFFFFL